MISAKIVLDSVGLHSIRLVTWELTYPRFIHSEFMTHRVFSRNAASSRAIPIQKMIRAVVDTPAEPVWWGKNQGGMQAKEELTGWRLWLARQIWFKSRYFAIAFAWLLFKVGLHKQIANRILEPWLHITVIATSSMHENFFKLRAHPDAQPEFQELAFKMKKLYEESTPRMLLPGEWHLPFIGATDGRAAYDYVDEVWKPAIVTSGDVLNVLKRISAARCARVSYVTHSQLKEIEADVELFKRLSTSGHWSPFEHQAECLEAAERSGNFVGWKQQRKQFATESGGDVQ